MAHPDIICPEVDQANLLQRIEELENELKQSKQTPLNISTPDLSSKAEERQLKDVCHPLPSILPAATTIWRDHLKDILEASMVVIMNGEGEREHFESWFELMLDHLTPVQLLKSVKTLPNMTHLRRVIEILQARHQHFLRTQSRFTGRKLKILVFGGSVTAVSVVKLWVHSHFTISAHHNHLNFHLLIGSSLQVPPYGFQVKSSAKALLVDISLRISNK